MKWKTRPGWAGKLSAKDIRHLNEVSIESLASLKSTRKEQKVLGADRKKRFPMLGNEVCWDCRFIAQKVGIES